MMKSRKGKEEKMMNFKEESHFVEYQLETFDPQKRDAVMKMLEKPDSFSEKQRYFEQFSAASRKKEPAFWNSIDLALEQYTSGINAYTKKMLSDRRLCVLRIVRNCPGRVFPVQILLEE